MPKIPVFALWSAAYAQIFRNLPRHNPEHSCPEAREMDWPWVKSKIVDYANTDEEARRRFASPEEAADWRDFVSRVYASTDLDFCPMAVLAVHLADVDHRLEEFTASELTQIFESEYEHFLSRMPFLLIAFSGWPIFRLFSQLARALRGMMQFSAERVQSANGTTCCGGFALGDLVLLAREAALLSSGRPSAALSKRVRRSSAELLSTMERVPEAKQSADCLLASAFVHFSQAVALSIVREPFPAKAALPLLEEMMESLEVGEAACHAAAAPPVGGLAALQELFASPWPIWDTLEQLQSSLLRPPWSLSCPRTPRAGSLPLPPLGKVCAACAAPQQAEWFRETQWVGALVAAGSRGDLGPARSPALAPSAVAEADRGAEAASQAAASRPGSGEDEAWATLLSDDDAEGGQGNDALLVYLEAIRVMARSVRRAEKRRPGRPFLVLTTATALTEEVRAALEGDGLRPLALPTFASQGAEVPRRWRKRGEARASASDDTPAELSWWMKIRLWALTEFRRIIYLDADILVHRSIDNLFALPDEVSFAAPAHSSADEQGPEVSVGIMSLRPSQKTYEAMLSFMTHAASRLSTGVRSVDQQLWHKFLVLHFRLQGHPVWDSKTGAFGGCAENAPSLNPGVDVGVLWTGSEVLGTACILPPQYDFCVSYPALAATEGMADWQDEILSQFAAPPLELDGGAAPGWARGMTARVLHWTGPRRKPWLHQLPLARTVLDGLWWRVHAELCAEADDLRRRRRGRGASDVAAAVPQPCRIECDLGDWRSA